MEGTVKGITWGRRIAAVASTGVLALLVGAGAATASPTPSPSAQVSGTVTIPAQLTLSLNGTSFSLNINPGTTQNTGIESSGGFVSTAVVTTNDGNGYDIYNVLPSAFSSGSSTIPGNDVSPYVYPANNNAGNAGNFSTAFSASTPSTVLVGSNNAPSNPSGDSWGQAWQFAIPGSQPGGTYTGSIEVLAAGL